MSTIITLAIDIALGALAYRLAIENRTRISGLEAKLKLITDALRKAGILDDSSD